ADPVDAARDRKCAVGFDRDGETAFMQARNQRFVNLEHWLATGQHNVAVIGTFAPNTGNLVSKRRGIGIFSSERPAGADKIGVAEAANGFRAVRLAPRP